MSFQNKIKNPKHFLWTAELNPPRSSSLSALIQVASNLKTHLDAINITDNSGAAMKMSSMAASHILQDKTGIEMIWQLTCRDRNRLALQSDLLGGYALGLRNILPLRGDSPNDALDLSKCFDLNTDQLIQAASNFASGFDLDSKALKEPFPQFCIGSAAHPAASNLVTQKDTMQRRFDLGVDFFQTQISFDIAQIEKFITSIGDDLASRTLVGITPIKNFKQANFMHKNIFGIEVPEKVLEDLSTLQDSEAQKYGLELASRLIDFVKTTKLKGVHIMAIGQESILDQIIKDLQNVQIT